MLTIQDAKKINDEEALLYLLYFRYSFMLYYIQYERKKSNF